MKFNRSTRRMFLQGSGGALVSIPFLTSLLPRETWAQTNTTIRRFLYVKSGYEMGHHSCWLPNIGDITNLGQPNQVAVGVNGHHNVRWQNLRDFAPTNGSVLASYYGSGISPYLESMNILRGLDYVVRYGHGGAQILGGLVLSDGDTTALQRTQTIDHVINSHPAFNPLGRSVINIGGHSGDSSQILTAGTINNAPNSGYDFNSIYNSLFSNGNYPENGQQGITNPKSNVLTRVLDDYNRLKNSKNISAIDKLALQNAMDKLSDVQNSLTAVATATCSYKNFFTNHPGVTLGSQVHDTSSELYMKALADIITAAMMCDTNRVFGIHLGVYGGVHDGLGFDHQITSHEPFGIVNGKPNWQRMNQRHSGFFQNFTAKLVQNLSAAIDSSNGKSLLYNSLIYQTTESGQVHGWGSHPGILFGNAGGNLTSGKYIDYSDRAKGSFDGVDTGGEFGFVKTFGSPKFSNNYYGVNYNRLLVTIMQAMGLQSANYENDAINAQLFNKTTIANMDIGTQNQNLTSIGGYGHAFPVDINVNSWGRNAFLPNLKFYDLKQYRYKLPIL